MLLSFVLTLVAADGAVDADRLYAAARAQTAVTVRCPARAEPGEVTVCGRRRTDRYRPPLVGPMAASRRDPTTAAREALLVAPSPCSQLGPYLVGCGHVGVGVGVSGGKTRLTTQRELAP